MQNKSDKPGAAEGRSGLSRRELLVGTGAAATAFSIMKPGLVRGSQVNSKITLGSIGCGSRGTWIANLFQKHGGYEITAAMDYFPDRVNAFGDKLNVPAGRRFTGLKGYQRLLDAKGDAVAIESPPYFHHGQAAAAVDAGSHVYLAKPMAVDVPGCRSIEASAKKAEEKKLAYLIDFQTRTDPFYQEAIRRVQKEGNIGRIISGEASYVAGSPWTRMIPDLEVNPQDPERRLRAWGVSRALSGEISIKGKANYAGGRDGMLYTTGAVRNISTFYDQVTSGRLDYSTVAPSVRSNLTTILGRTAAYKLAEFTWD